MGYFETRQAGRPKAYGYFVYEADEAGSRDLELHLASTDAQLRSTTTDGEWVVNHVDTSARFRRVVREVGRYLGGLRIDPQKSG